MGLRNIMALRSQQHTSQGAPLAGGTVKLYEPGTTSYIAAYKDKDLTLPHTRPIRLSGSARANIWITADCDLRIEDRNGNLILTEDNANPDNLGGTGTGGLQVNGGFETDTTGDGTPDGWTLTSESGSTNTRITSDSTAGAAAFRFTSTGSGGGSLVSSDFMAVNDTDDLRVWFDLMVTNAIGRVIVRIEWYDISQVTISNTDVYTSITNPLAWTTNKYNSTPPSLARFAKIRLIGVDPSTAVSGSVTFDEVSVFYPAVVSGIFDNLELRNNEIITTDTNGDLDLKPHGTGAVNIEGGDDLTLTDAKNALNVMGDSVNPLVAIGLLAGDLPAIQGKATATTAATLFIQQLGGDLDIGAGDFVFDAATGKTTLALAEITSLLEADSLTVTQLTTAVGGLVIGDGSSQVGLIIDSGGTDSPSVVWKRNGITAGFISYDNISGYMLVESDTSIEFSPGNTVMLTLDEANSRVEIAATMGFRMASGSFILNADGYIDSYPGTPADNNILSWNDSASRAEFIEFPIGGSNSNIQYNDNDALAGSPLFRINIGGTTLDMVSLTNVDGLTSGNLLAVTSNETAKTGTVVSLVQDHVSAVASVLGLRQDGPGDWLLFESSGSDVLIHSAGNGMDFIFSVEDSGGTRETVLELGSEAGTVSSLRGFFAGVKSFESVQGGIEFNGIAGSTDKFSLTPEYARANAAQSISSSVTLTDSTELTAELSAGTYYEFDAVLRFRTFISGAQSIKWSINFPDCSALVEGIALSFDGSAGSGDPAATNESIYKNSIAGKLDTPDRLIGVDISDNSVVIIKGHVLASSPGGTVTVQFAQNVSSGDAVQLNIGSFIRFNPVI